MIFIKTRGIESKCVPKYHQEICIAYRNIGYSKVSDLKSLLSRVKCVYIAAMLVYNGENKSTVSKLMRIFSISECQSVSGCNRSCIYSCSDCVF